jgi:hypothetical protein
MEGYFQRLVRANFRFGRMCAGPVPGDCPQLGHRGHASAAP